MVNIPSFLQQNNLTVFRNSKEGFLYSSFKGISQQLNIIQGNVFKIYDKDFTGKLISQVPDLQFLEVKTGDGIRTFTFNGTRNTAVTGGGGGLGQSSVINLINQFAFPYKKYVANLFQDGTPTPPIATIFENTLGGVPVWSYDGVGQYRATLTGLLTSGKTVLFIGTRLGGVPVFYSFYSNDGDTAVLVTRNSASVLMDGLLSNTAVEIRVYP